jgi:hypothetical protein
MSQNSPNPVALVAGCLSASAGRIDKWNYKLSFDSIRAEFIKNFWQPLEPLRCVQLINSYPLVQHFSGRGVAPNPLSRPQTHALSLAPHPTLRQLGSHFWASFFLTKGAKINKWQNLVPNIFFDGASLDFFVGGFEDNVRLSDMSDIIMSDWKRISLGTKNFAWACMYWAGWPDWANSRPLGDCLLW